MLPAAAAIAAWLAAGRAWRLACVWSLLFMLALALVAASKIAYLGWRFGFPPLDFKAFSGHAMCTSSVFPTAFYLLLQRSGAARRNYGIALGLVLGISMSILLVALNEHSVSEVAAGFFLGAGASLSFIGYANTLPAQLQNHRRFAVSALVFAVVWLAHPESIGYWLVWITLYFSPHDQLAV